MDAWVMILSGSTPAQQQASKSCSSSLGGPVLTLAEASSSDNDKKDTWREKLDQELTLQIPYRKNYCIAVFNSRQKGKK